MLVGNEKWGKRARPRREVVRYFNKAKRKGRGHHSHARRMTSTPDVCGVDSTQDAVYQTM